MPRVPTGRELTDDQRLAVYHRLLQLKTNGRVSQGQMKLLMHEFKVTQQTISRIWARGRDSAASTGCAKLSSRKKGRCGAPPKYATTDVRTIITSTPTADRSTFRSSTGVPKTSLWRLLQAKKLSRRTNLPWRVLDKTFMTLQKVKEESMKVQGDNVYKLPYLRKDVQEKAGVRELRPSCEPEVVAALEALESRLADEDLVDEMAELFNTSSDFAQVEKIVVSMTSGLWPYTLLKTDFMSQATSRDLAEFYSTKDYVPQGNRIDALNISKMYLDQVEHSEFYVVDPTLSVTDRDARLAEIKAHTTAI
ncbi:hypothetical protein B5M09_013413 [Aphanomyces astaci]|uniref:DUF7769 domain-containing protein n=1 Tax=Aphanomyces astaci TaxID=112090 RepID=A0A425DPZ6_APHAT|nr:hypothetical protein B5M09_013413 [Aphanomyces astaci]